MGADQRKEARIAIEARFSARDLSGAGTLTFTTEDLSASGAFLKSDLLLEQGEALALQFDVPGTGAIHTPARVAWVRRFPQGDQAPGMGVEFLALNDDDRAAMNRWLRS